MFFLKSWYRFVFWGLHVKRISQDKVVDGIEFVQTSVDRAINGEDEDLVTPQYVPSPYIRCSMAPSYKREAIAEIDETVENAADFSNILHFFIRQYMGGNVVRCYKRAGISRQLYSKIVSNKVKRVSKRTVFQFCVGLMLSYYDAEDLLESAGYAFSKSSYEDMAFAWCLKNGVYNLLDVNEILVGCNCEPISIN